MATTQLIFAIACGVIAVIYGLWSRRWVLHQDPGNGRMQEIALTEWPTMPIVDPTIYQVVRSRVQNMYVSIDGTEKGLAETWVSV